MTDTELVEHLRRFAAAEHGGSPALQTVLVEAADAIERLQSQYQESIRCISVTLLELKGALLSTPPDLARAASDRLMSFLGETWRWRTTK